MENIPGETDVAVIPVKRANSNNSIMNRSLLWTWFCVGCLAFALDDSVQPHIKALGRHRTVNLMAENWQRIAETGGIIAFVVAMAVVGRGLLKPAVCALLGVAVAGQFSKYCFGRVRPHRTGDLTVFHGPLGLWGDGQRVPVDSLPSGHTAVAFAMAHVLTARWPKLKWIWFCSGLRGRRHSHTGRCSFFIRCHLWGIAWNIGRTVGSDLVGRYRARNHWQKISDDRSEL